MLYVIIGIILGVVIGFAWIVVLTKKDNKKFDSDSKMVPSETFSFKADTWKDDNLWKSETIYTPKWENVNTKSKGARPKKQTLEKQLKDAVEIEDYETAAKLRDKINKLKSK